MTKRVGKDACVYCTQCTSAALNKQHSGGGGGGGWGDRQLYTEQRHAELRLGSTVVTVLNDVWLSTNAVLPQLWSVFATEH
jgi:hypothetical protein